MRFRITHPLVYLAGVIDDPPKLAALVSRIRSADWVALDTEADSLHAYPEKLCLIQISLPGENAIVDPLAGVDLTPLLDVLKDRELILHGADYDLRLLWKSFRFRPRAIFDTMWAARLLGYEEFGLLHLVAKVLEITLEKGPQKMNWARRPLPERMEQYARNDTRYLRALAEALSTQLEQLGRGSWLREVCARVIQECAQDRVQDPDEVWRVKGSNRLSRRGLAILRELWHWREHEAIERNKPPYFILSHEKLTALAAAAAENGPLAELVPPAFSPARRARMMEALECGLRHAASAHPKHRRGDGRRLTKVEQHRFEEFKRRRDERAGELKIDPSLIASRAALVALALDGDGRTGELMTWQLEVLRDPPVSPDE
ncbi:MAG: HRDC domain-containing protein [Verrucomicrobia bacterium]|nr:HRDC domain-containing protein [Verrucomicrobiota bacterium]